MAYSTIDKSTNYFFTKTYSGTGSSGAKGVTGVGFQPDFLWIKNRDQSQEHWLADAVRGTTKFLESDSSNAESSDGATGLASFDADGFTLGTGSNRTNQSGSDMVAWNWLAGGTAPTKTYTVKVVSDSGNKYRFDDFGTSAVTLDLQEGGTYTFDVSDSSMNSHPFVLGTSSGTDGSYDTGVTYKLDGVTKTYSQYTSGFSSASSRQLIITVAGSAPTLYYNCSVHSGMGGSINTNATFGSSNFDGSIQTLVSANTTAKFSIIRWTGTGSAGTIAHGLGVTPGMIFVKKTSQTDSWFVWHTYLGQQGKLNLDNNSAIQNDTGYWNNTLPTNQVFSVTSNGANNASGETYIAYCFANVPGYCKIGSYVGNGSADGTFVYTGFKPSFLLHKTTATDGWRIIDNKRLGYNPNNSLLQPNISQADSDQTWHDIMSNGFKLRTTDAGDNANGTTYIYMAIGQSIVGSNNIPATAR